MRKLKTRCMAALLSFSMMVSMMPEQTVVSAAGKSETEDAASHLLANYVFSEGNVENTTIKDLSGNHQDATLMGSGATIADGTLTLPGGNAGSSAAYVSIPGTVFENQDVLTISLWLKNGTGANNYSAMSFGTPTTHYGTGTANMPLNYWLLNPASPSGYFKSVWTDSNNASAPYNTETATSTAKTDANWGMYTTVITKDSITGYYNGVKVSESSKTKTTSDFGTGLVAAIGRSGYNDMFYKGGVRDVAVYDSALTKEEIFGIYYDTIPDGNKESVVKDAISYDEEALTLGDLSAVTSNLVLPSLGDKGSKITWNSSNPDIISETGVVTRPTTEENAEVTLTATLQIGEEMKTKEFKATVVSASIKHLFDEVVGAFTLSKTAITESIDLPATAGKVNGKDTTITWTTSNEAVLTSDGQVAARPEAGSNDETVTLTAEIRYEEKGTVVTTTKAFTITVRAKGNGYLMAYTNSKESAVLGDSLHLAYSKDGVNYTALNSNTGICFARNVGGSKNTNPNGLLAPHLFRKADGSYGLLARNMSSQSYFYVYDSKDLIDFSNEHTIAVEKKVSDILQCSYEDAEESYVIYWNDGTTTYKTMTKDLTTADKTEVVSEYTKPELEQAGTWPEGAVAGNVLDITKTEYDRVVNKLGVVTNTGMEEVAVTADENSDLTSLLPEKVTADYSDGSKTDMNVSWNEEELKKIDLTTAGTYKVTGTVGQTTYANPFITQRADPCIEKGQDGYYYFTASYPMCGGSDKDGYDKVTLRRSKTIEGLQTAEEVTIWDCDDSATEYRYIWAPEFHCVNGVYYVFYTSSINSSVWSIRPHVLMCTDASRIMEPSAWVAKGQMLANEADSQAFNGFSLDMTYFENNGRHYVMWAQTDGFSSLFIAEINPDKPWQCISDCVKISIPEYSWERINENVNEGPSVLHKDGKLYCTFSASGTGTEYCIGLLTAEEDADLLDASSWKKQSYPVLTSSDVKGEYGPGHNSFTVDEDGNAIFVYHARGEECYNKECAWANEGSLYDPCRDARIKRVHWAADGSPILKMTYEEELAEENKTVTATIQVAESATKYTVKYEAGKGGTVAGTTTQTVAQGMSGEKVTAVPDTGYHFVSWSDGVKTAERMESNVRESKTLTAQFAKNSYQLTYKASTGGKVTGNTTQTVAYGENGTKVTAVAQKGYTFVSWSDGVKSASRTDKEVKKALTVTAKFTKAPVEVKKLTLNKKKLTLGVGEQVKIKASISPSSATNQTLTWKSNSSCVKVSKKGVITAKKTGTAVVTVTASNGKKATCKVTVKKAPKKITLTKEKKTLKKGKSYQIQYQLPKNTASNQITFSSSKQSVAFVSSTGKVTAKKKGTATITVKTYNGKKAIIKITVK